MALKINDNGTTRDMTPDEEAAHLAWAAEAQAEAEATIAAIEAKDAAKASALAKLGLTADEATALFG